VIRSNGSRLPPPDASCDFEIDRDGEGETQIAIENLSPGAYIEFSLPCAGPDGTSIEGCWTFFGYYSQDGGMELHGGFLAKYLGMHVVRIPSSKIRLRVKYASPAEEYIITYGPAVYDVCGDGIVDIPEKCDDMNTVSGDGCSSRCWQECDWNNCCVVDLPEHGNYNSTMRIDDELQDLLPGHELSADSSCVELRIPAHHAGEMASMLDVLVKENYYSENCPFWGSERPLKLIGPECLLSASEGIPSDSSQIWTSLTWTSPQGYNGYDYGYGYGYGGGYEGGYGPGPGYGYGGGYGSHSVPDLGFDFCMLGQNMRGSIEVHRDSFVTFGLNAPIEYATNPSSPTLFVNSLRDPASGFVEVSGVFGTHIIDDTSPPSHPRRGYLVRFEATQYSYDRYGYGNPTEIMWEITFFNDSTIHVANARGHDADATDSMLTDGNGNTIMRFGRQTQVSHVLQPTLGCGMLQADQPCSMLKVEGQTRSSTVISTNLQKFRSSQGFVVTHTSKKTTNPWHMPIDMVFWQGSLQGRCGNGVLDSSVMTVHSVNCQVTDSSQRVCSQNIVLPDVPADGSISTLIDIRVDANLFAYNPASKITDVYIDGIRIGGDYLSSYSDVACGEFEQIVEYVLPTESNHNQSPGLRNITVEIFFQHDDYWWQENDVPCYCSPCNGMVLNAKVDVKWKEATEECDDANYANGDGCSARCLVEPGANCTGATSHSGPSVCSGGSGEEPCSNSASKCLVDIPYDNIKWGQDPRYLDCSLPMTWGEMLRARFTNCSLSYKTGGLGHLLVKDAFESWLCVHDHPCASNYAQDPYFCFVFDEQRERFVPWGENAELRIVKL